MWDEKKYNSEYWKKNKERILFQKKERRHRVGESKRYNSGNPFSLTNEYKRFHRKKYKALRNNGGELSIKTIQLIYEDNIKRFGTLTCYLCLQPISFGKDHLEHKTPLSRGGNNEYNNLEIACKHCNNKKHNKTVKEFLEVT